MALSREEIAARYGTALFGYAQDNKVLDTVYDEMMELKKAAVASPKFISVLSDPILSSKDKKSLLTAVEKANAKNIYILPNNGNIIMAANQVKDVVKDKSNVVVIPSKTIMQGVVAAMNFNPDLSIKDNEKVMNESLSSVKSGQVTFAIKDTEINGIKVKKDEFMAILNSKDILSSHKNKFDALKVLLKNMVDEDSSVITILLGQDVASEKDKEKVEKYIEKEFKDCDADVRIGYQPVYSFIVGVE